MLLLDKWERQAMADRQALLGQGVTEDLPTFSDTQARLDAALVAESTDEHSDLDPEQLELRQALGVL